MKFEKIYPRDIIAAITLVAIFALYTKGYDGWLQGLSAMIIGYYFSKRIYEEENRQ